MSAWHKTLDELRVEATKRIFNVPPPAGPRYAGTTKIDLTEAAAWAKHHTERAGPPPRRVIRGWEILLSCYLSGEAPRWHLSMRLDPPFRPRRPDEDRIVQEIKTYLGAPDVEAITIRKNDPTSPRHWNWPA